MVGLIQVVQIPEILYARIAFFLALGVDCKNPVVHQGKHTFTHITDLFVPRLLRGFLRRLLGFLLAPKMFDCRRQSRHQC
jgi:hypothetical protein